MDMLEWIDRLRQAWLAKRRAGMRARADGRHIDRVDREAATDAAGAAPDEQAADPHLGYLG